MESKQKASAEITKEQAYILSQKYINDNPIEAEKIRASFEKSFGVDSKSRTKKQWQNLLRVYGMETVKANEGLTEDEIMYKCTETLSQRLNRIAKIRNTINGKF